jgi:hypothetical protein
VEAVVTEPGGKVDSSWSIQIEQSRTPLQFDFAILGMVLPVLIWNLRRLAKRTMTPLKQIRWTAVTMLIIGLGLAVSSGWIEKEAIAATEGHFAHSASVMAGKMFTVASILILLWAMEWQRAKTAARLQHLESELASLKQRTVAA